jgi:CRP-like cAMP-binding protein
VNENLAIIGKGGLIGDDDVICGGNFSSSLTCISQQGEMLFLKKDDFFKLQQYEKAWMEILKAMIEKRKKVKKTLKQSRQAVSKLETAINTKSAVAVAPKPS